MVTSLRGGAERRRHLRRTPTPLRFGDFVRSVQVSDPLAQVEIASPIQARNDGIGIIMKQTWDWQIASVQEIRPETAKVKSLTLALPAWMRHRAGQHYDIRLTAEDGYQTQRSYSIASEPERAGEVDITVERIDDGEVSTYLHDVLIPGDRIEVRGPIGGYFTWEAMMTEPLLLIAGG